jgi:hypothetical protein
VRTGLRMGTGWGLSRAREGPSPRELAVQGPCVQNDFFRTGVTSTCGFAETSDSTLLLGSRSYPPYPVVSRPAWGRYGDSRRHRARTVPTCDVYHTPPTVCRFCPPSLSHATIRGWRTHDAPAHAKTAQAV